MDNKPELNYDQKLSYKSQWWRYFGEYQYLVNLVFKSLKGSEITNVALPLAFLIRHTLEIGYKTDLLELQKVSGVTAKIEYKGKSAHKIDDLHREFEIQMRAVFKKYNAEKRLVKEFDDLNSKLVSLKRLIHKLDELSYAFRYPVANDGSTLNFNTMDEKDRSDVLNFKEIKGLYDDSLKLIKYSTDVAQEIIEAYNKANGSKAS